MAAKQHILSAEQFVGATETVARELLGKYLVRRYRGRELAYLITETEAYDGPHDLACHAARGRTGRTEVMFGPAGHWYVYLCYGIHWMLNIVTGPTEYPAAVLIRGVEGISGPGRVTRALHVTHTLNTKPATPTSHLWIEDRGIVIPNTHIEQTPRIGVAYAGTWAHKPLRFVLTGDLPTPPTHTPQ